MKNNVLVTKKVFGTARLNVRLPNANVLQLVTLKNEIPVDKLEEAIIKVSKKHCLINSRLRVDSDNSIWYEIIDFMKPLIYRADGNETLEEIMIKEFQKAFDLDNGPLIRFIIINQKSQTYLLICCHHVICDGLALVYLTNDIFKAIAYPEYKIKQINKPILQDENTVPEKLKKSFLTKLVINSINKKWQKKDLIFDASKYSEIQNEFWNNHKPGILIWDLSKEQTKRLVKRSKENGVTINTTITTAFLRAEKDVLNKKEYSEEVIISVSLRDYLRDNPEDTMGFFASAIRPKLRYEADKGFWDNAKDFHKKIKRLITETNVFKSQVIGLFNPNFIDALALGKFNKCEDKTVKKMIQKKKMNVINTTFTLTNLGRISIDEEVRQHMITSILGPTVYGDTMDKYIGVITINNQIFFSISFNQNIISKDDIKKIKNKIIEYVEEM